MGTAGTAVHELQPPPPTRPGARAAFEAVGLAIPVRVAFALFALRQLWLLLRWRRAQLRKALKEPRWGGGRGVAAAAAAAAGKGLRVWALVQTKPKATAWQGSVSAGPPRCFWGVMG